MALLNCPECNEKITSEDEICPKCNAQLPKPVTRIQKIEGFFLKLITYGCLINLGIVIITILVLVIIDLFF